MNDITLQVQRRATGKKASKAVRNKGLVPGVFYMDGKEGVAIATPTLSLRPIVYTSDTHIVHLQIEGDSAQHDCVLKDIYFDPVTDRIMHFDLQGLSADRKITVEVPVILKGQARGLRDGGVIQHSLHKIEIECLPADLPDHIEIDMTDLGIGDSIHINDLKLGNMRTLDSGNAVVVAVVPPTVGRDVEAGTGATAEPALVNEKGKKSEA